jgi:chaperone BCS1
MHGTTTSWLNMQVLAGSISVMLISSAAGLIFLIGKRIIDYFYHTFMISVELTNKDEAYDWVMQWCANYAKTGGKFISAQKVTLNIKKGATSGPARRPKDDDEKPELQFLPGKGSHIFWYKGKMVWMQRHFDGNPMTTGWNNQVFQSERLVLSCYGRRKDFFLDLLNEAMDLSYARDVDKTKIYVLRDWGSDWKQVLTKPIRSIESVILDGAIASHLIKDAKEFLESESWYQEHGIPYRRGYLLHGPPGTGKSSFAQALAGNLKFSICVLSLSNQHLNDQELNNCLHNAPKKSVILLEDVDAVFVDRNIVSQEKPKGGVSFSGLLNAIDGVASQEGRILVMTTNHIEKLDPALIRPGRCDIKVRLSYASRKQIFQMFLNIYGDEHQELASEFADLIPVNSLSMAQLQSYFMEYRKQPNAAMQNYRKLVKLADETTGYGKGAEALEGDGINFMKSSSFGDTLISHWLKRLGLYPYKPLFDKHRLTHLSDIKLIDPSKLCSIVGINHPAHCKIIEQMMTGKSEDTVSKFAFVTKADLRNIFTRFFPRDAFMAEEFSSLHEKDTVSVHEVEVYMSFFTNQPRDALRYFKGYVLGELVLSMEEKLEQPLRDWLSTFEPAQEQKVEQFVVPQLENWLFETMNVANTEEVVSKIKDAGIESLEQVLAMSESKEFSWNKYGIDKDGLKWKLEKEVKAMNEKKSKSKTIIDILCDPDKSLKKLGQVVDMDEKTLTKIGVEDSSLRYELLNAWKDMQRFKTAKPFCLMKASSSFNLIQEIAANAKYPPSKYK